MPFLRQPGGGCLVRVGSQVRIYFRSRLPPERRDFVVAHELAHWALVDHAGNELDTEVACDTLAALRFGETTDEPLVLVAPLSVRVRGAAYSWPSEPALREIASARKPGLRKAVLRDDGRRFTLMA